MTQRPPANRWRTLAKFSRSWWGVGTGLALAASALVTGVVTVGGRVLRAVELPGRIESRVAELEARHLTDVEARDSVFAFLSGRDAKLDSIMGGIQLFFDLYRCTEAGYDGHNCPLMGDDMGIEPLTPADRQPSLGPGPRRVP